MTKLNNRQSIRTKNLAALAASAGIAGALAITALAPSQAAAAGSPATLAQRQAAWTTAIAKTPTPRGGCFTAHFPSTTWTQTDCIQAPARPYLPTSGTGHAETTGDGNDYAAFTSGLTSQAVGSFPSTKGLKSETGYGGRPNYYSLQVNSNFMSNDKACSGSSNPSKCLGWEQFVYSSSSAAAFMQYWLIHYAATCPSGYYTYADDCYKNSAAVRVPLQVIKQLKNIKLSGNAVHNGIDTLTMTTKDQAYSTTGQDSVVYLADGWNASEFNVIGDGGGSSANFNPGTKLTVEIDTTDGTTNAPTCKGNSGTTGETNNLNLGSCTTSGGSNPNVQFLESLKK